jgi:alcohol dehydrogenase (NADP+)
MLDLAVAKGIKAWVQVRPMSEASQAVKDMHASKAKYRYVLKN